MICFKWNEHLDWSIDAFDMSQIKYYFYGVRFGNIKIGVVIRRKEYIPKAMPHVDLDDFL